MTRGRSSLRLGCVLLLWLRSNESSDIRPTAQGKVLRNVVPSPFTLAALTPSDVSSVTGSACAYSAIIHDLYLRLSPEVLTRELIPRSVASRDDKQEELSHSIPSSARDSRACGIVRPNALAALRLVTGSILLLVSAGNARASVPPKNLHLSRAARYPTAATPAHS
jgi:hypothetical protein